MDQDRSVEERLVAALEASRAGTWRWDIASDTVSWDTAMSRLYGIPHEQSPRSASEFLQFVHPDDRDHAAEVIGGCLKEGSAIEYQFRALVPGGVKWIYDRSRLARDENGRPLYMTGACLDITERKAMEDQLRKAIADRELLLKEFGHRVANSLQLISAMLTLQARDVADPQAREHLRSAVDRVSAVSRLNAQLYLPDESGSVRLDEFLRQLVDDFRAALTRNSPIRIEVEADPTEIDYDRGSRLGLVLNEILTNAVKYAFPERRPGEIRVRLEKQPDRIAVSVSDDGIGFVNGHKPGTGTLLIHHLCEQIGASLELKTDAGTSYRITLPA